MRTADIAERERRVAEAIHSVEMAGLQVTEATLPSMPLDGSTPTSSLPERVRVTGWIELVGSQSPEEGSR